MILVPLGLHQSRGDQMVNAKIFSAKGWASWIAEEELTPQRLLAEIEQIYGRHNEIEEKLQNAPGAQTAVQLAGVLLSYVRGEPIPEPFD
jgi:UDP-N-acetylglucosamine--N-acetylmuramyl-(pentapeptide) pyrophosphoryl-undecaprenol N-acetylglucosamine transferase